VKWSPAIAGSKENLYFAVARALNKEFRSVLTATATEVGISVAAKMPLDYRRLMANIEESRALKGTKLTVTLMDSGFICIS
jgi:hypothetical protein